MSTHPRQTLQNKHHYTCELTRACTQAVHPFRAPPRPRRSPISRHSSVSLLKKIVEGRSPCTSHEGQDSHKGAIVFTHRVHTRFSPIQTEQMSRRCRRAERSKTITSYCIKYWYREYCQSEHPLFSTRANINIHKRLKSQICRGTYMQQTKKQRPSR